MHKSPLIQIVVFQLDIAAIQAVEDILSPWNQQPHNRAVFLGNGIQDDLRCRSFKEHSPAACTQASHPVEFRTGVIKRRDAQEHIISTRFVMLLFHLCSLHQTFVIM